MAEDYGASGGTTYVNTGSVATGAVGAAANIFGTLYNNWQAGKRERDARRENYLYNEMAAEAADARTRALYNDLYSANAQLQQIKDAGLSPSVFYGDGGGISGQSGAQGAGPNGVSPNVYGLDPLAAAQIALTMAQTNKTKAETKNIDVDTDRQEIAKQLEEMQKNMYTVDFTIATLYTINTETGERTSLYDIAANFDTYEKFSEYVKETTKKSFGKNSIEAGATVSEQGQKAIRAIYVARHKMSHDIAVLGSEETSAKFQKSICDALNKEGFAKQNATTAVKQLETAAETADLTKTQKESWNNLLKKLGDGTTRDIIVVMAMILNQAASQYVHTNIGLNSSTTHKVE